MAETWSITAFCCHNALYGRKDLAGLDKAALPGVHIVEVPCTGKVEPIYLLKPFENGADAVVVLACPPRQCMTIEGARRQARRIARTKDLLAEAGLEPERLMLFMGKKPAAGQLPGILRDVQKTLKKLGPSPVA